MIDGIYVSHPFNHHETHTDLSFGHNGWMQNRVFLCNKRHIFTCNVNKARRERKGVTISPIVGLNYDTLRRISNFDQALMMLQNTRICIRIISETCPMNNVIFTVSQSSWSYFVFPTREGLHVSTRELKSHGYDHIRAVKREAVTFISLSGNFYLKKNQCWRSSALK